MFQHTAARRRLGSAVHSILLRILSFNTQPPEGGWPREDAIFYLGNDVSTHSRPKAAGHEPAVGYYAYMVSTHSRPKAAGV